MSKITWYLTYFPSIEWHLRLEQNAKSRASPPNIYSYHCPLRGDIRKNWNDTEKGSSARHDFNTEFRSSFLIWEFPFLDLNFDSALGMAPAIFTPSSLKGNAQTDCRVLATLWARRESCAESVIYKTQFVAHGIAQHLRAGNLKVTLYVKICKGWRKHSIK